MNIRDWVQEGLKRSRPQPEEQVEIFALSREEQSWEWNEGRLENRESIRSFGAGVRILAQGAVGFSYRADMRLESLESAVGEARSQLAYSQPDPARALPAMVTVAAAAEVTAESRDEAARMAIGERLEAAARAADPRVTKISQTVVRERREWVGLANTQGLSAAWPRDSYLLGAAVLAESGSDTQIGEEYRAWRGWTEMDPETVGRTAGERAAGQLGGRPLATGKRTLLLGPHIAAGILEAAWEAWSGDAVQRGRSFLAGRLGQRIAAEGVTLVDDGLLARGLATAPLDEEGTPSQRTVLVAGGKLEGFLYHEESARRARASSTGNGQRGGFKGMPSVGPTNFMLLAGSQSPEALLALAEQGVAITEVMGLHMLDPVTGEFSLGASGRLVEAGRPGKAVRGITIAGTVEGLLSQVVGIGRDLTFYGNFGAPSLVVEGIMVSGS